MGRMPMRSMRMRGMCMMGILIGSCDCG
jgi:hypothetical protein